MERLELCLDKLAVDFVGMGGKGKLDSESVAWKKCWDNLLNSGGLPVRLVNALPGFMVLDLARPERDRVTVTSGVRRGASSMGVAREVVMEGRCGALRLIELVRLGGPSRPNRLPDRRTVKWACSPSLMTSTHGEAGSSVMGSAAVKVGETGAVCNGERLPIPHFPSPIPIPSSDFLLKLKDDRVGGTSSDSLWRGASSDPLGEEKYELPTPECGVSGSNIGLEARTGGREGTGRGGGMGIWV